MNQRASYNFIFLLTEGALSVGLAWKLLDLLAKCQKCILVKLYKLAAADNFEFSLQIFLEVSLLNWPKLNIAPVLSLHSQNWFFDMITQLTHTAAIVAQR